jgi:hypothetical protein
MNSSEMRLGVDLDVDSNDADAQFELQPQAQPRKKGRPKGSKNKPKEAKKERKEKKPGVEATQSLIEAPDKAVIPSKRTNGKSLVDKASSLDLRGPVVVDGYVHFSPYDLMRYELHRTKAQVLDKTAASLLLKRKEMQLRYEASCSELAKEEAALAVAKIAFHEEFQKFTSEIEMLYDVSLEKISYCPETGRLRDNGIDLAAT